MTSKELAQRAKELRKVEQSIKTLERIRKDLASLEKLDFDSFRKIITDESTFADDMYYTIEHCLQVLETRLR